MLLENAGGLVYGAILVATLLAAENARRETYLKSVAAVVLTLLAYWLSLAYAEYAGERLEQGIRFTYGGLLRTARHEVSVVYGATIPLIVIVVFWALGASLGTAIEVAIYCDAGAIVVTELVIGVRADLKGMELVRQTVVGAALGLVVIGLRLLLH